jgi:uncharacterized protein YndB with AHSA1/START domain
MMAGHDFTISRVFNAPRALVFKMWADPKHRARWWHPPDAPTDGVIEEIISPERIVIVTQSDDGLPFNVVNTVTFEDLGHRTKLTVHAQLRPRSARDRRPRHGRDAFAAMTA